MLGLAALHVVLDGGGEMGFGGLLIGPEQGAAWLGGLFDGSKLLLFFSPLNHLINLSYVYHSNKS